MESHTVNLVLLYTAVLLLLSQVNGCGRRRGGSSRPSCSPRTCRVSSWSSWTECSHRCGNAGVKAHYRYKEQSESCGGLCPYHLSESTQCNRDRCKHYIMQVSGGCLCMPGWKGTCCYDGEFSE